MMAEQLLLEGFLLESEDGGALEELAASLEASRPTVLMDPVARGRLRSELRAEHAASIGLSGQAPRARPAGTAQPVQYGSMETPFGTLWVAFRGRAVCYTDLDVPEALFYRQCTGRFGSPPVREKQLPEAVARPIRRYLEEGGRFSGQVDLSQLPEFHQRVLRKAMEIRRGEVRPYAWLAREVGAPQAARAVGTAMARNPIPILVPCHRVVRSDYRIGEYGCGGPAKKRAILSHEGVDVDRLEQLANRGIRFLGARSTHIFCLPGCYTGRRMKPDRHVPFASEADARAAGYRPCKVCRPA